MTKLKLSYSLLILVFVSISCSVEKINLSPVGLSDSKTSNDTHQFSLTEKKNLIFYSSEITNLIATFPKFSNGAVNSEIIYLKGHLRDLILAIEQYDLKKIDKTEAKFEKSYKNLQKLKKYLKTDESEVLNRYLVKIKINISQLSSLIPNDADSLQ